MNKKELEKQIKDLEEGQEVTEFAKLYCLNCSKLLCEEAIFWGKIRIKCYNCNTIMTFERIPEIEVPQVKVKRPKDLTSKKK